MKITAEFNSNEELLSFISAFGVKNLSHGQAIAQEKNKTVSDKKEVKREVSKADAPKEDKKEIPKVNAEVVEVEQKTKEIKDAEEVKKEDPQKEQKITKETVRAVFTKLLKAGKQKEAKELTAKYGASKLPDLKEEDYAAAYKEAEGLL